MVRLFGYRWKSRGMVFSGSSTLYFLGPEKDRGSIGDAVVKTLWYLTYTMGIFLLVGFLCCFVFNVNTTEREQFEYVGQNLLQTAILDGLTKSSREIKEKNTHSYLKIYFASKDFMKMEKTYPEQAVNNKPPWFHFLWRTAEISWRTTWCRACDPSSPIYMNKDLLHIRLACEWISITLMMLSELYVFGGYMVNVSV